MNAISYQMGEFTKDWRDNEAQVITFCITEDCNLACKYCYIVGKNTTNKMSFEIARDAVDFILKNSDDFKREAVIWEFIGGEPFLEIDLIDRICDYIKVQMYTLDHPWFGNYRFSFSSNGIYYSTQKVQNFIKKNHHKVSIGISVDGNQTKHDLQRIFPDGSGSYDLVVNSVPLWQEQFPNTHTKATFSHEDLPHLMDSVISLWNLGIKDVSANIIYEDVWHEGDNLVFEEQLKKLADYIIENDLWIDHKIRFFQKGSFGLPFSEEDLNSTYCGAGKMVAIDYQGKLYPCLRFVDYSLNKRDGYSVGDIYSGFNRDKLRPFELLTIRNQSPKECIECNVASGCSWCVGNNYDVADSGTLFKRTTFNCEMHKANCRANDYFWSEFEKKTGMTVDRKKGRLHNTRQNYLQIILSTDASFNCLAPRKFKEFTYMNDDVFFAGLEFCEKNNYIPVFIGEIPSSQSNRNALRVENLHNSESPENSIIVFDHNINQIDKVDAVKSDNCILVISRSEINELAQLIEKIYLKFSRINLVISDLEEWSPNDLDSYDKQLKELSKIILSSYFENESPLELNVLTDILDLNKMSNCDAGEHTFTLAPNGKFYTCAAFYFENESDSIGDLTTGIDIKDKDMLSVEKSPLCNSCDSYHCKRCKYLNKKLTSQINIPSKVQCVISHIERKNSYKLRLEINKSGFVVNNNFEDNNYLDPLEVIISKRENFKFKESEVNV
ncbi:radical SAM peptide maturase, CXXX-repeat target family [Paenibacillus sp. P32E]|uniref:radical SAM peptide maturase, CXXX-repeat target family n=1 Tax=Paenibacillus sp. P32E TaxID=1349434 RepID=UPI0015B91BE3|nr:radical SAM peptide maturase, CXXX-repeat target family [Paenibacillus sp. P32E]